MNAFQVCSVSILKCLNVITLKFQFPCDNYPQFILPRQHCRGLLMNTYRIRPFKLHPKHNTTPPIYHHSLAPRHFYQSWFTLQSLVLPEYAITWKSHTALSSSSLNTQSRQVPTNSFTQRYLPDTSLNNTGSIMHSLRRLFSIVEHTQIRHSTMPPYISALKLAWLFLPAIFHTGFDDALIAVTICLDLIYVTTQHTNLLHERRNVPTTGSVAMNITQLDF